MTVAERIKLEARAEGWRDSIAWAEEQLVKARAWQSEHGLTFATPADWEHLIGEFRYELMRTERRLQRGVGV